MNKKIVHDALILTVFTVVIGFILGLVYEITKDPIAKAEEATAQAAYKAVFEDADSFSTYDFDAEAAASLLEQNGYSDEINGVQEALDKDGNILGYVITVTAKDGSQGNITFSDRKSVV